MGRRLPIICALMLLMGAVSTAGLAQTTEPANLIHRSAPATASSSTAAATAPDASRVMLSLTAVLSLIVLLTWCVKKLGRGRFGAGTRAIQVLGRAYVSSKHQVMVLQVGRRLLVVGETSHQLTTLCEITDPDEAAALIGQLRGTEVVRSDPSTSFATMLRRASERFHDEPPIDITPRDAEPDPQLSTARQELNKLADRVRIVARHLRGTSLLLVAALLLGVGTTTLRAQEVSANPAPSPPSAAPIAVQKVTSSLSTQLPDLMKRENVGSTVQLVALLTVLSLAPAILLMVTSFTRIIIVLTLLRQALGAQQLPPNQVLAGLAVFMTFLVMTPTWNRVNNEALQPYMNGQIDQATALTKGIGPVRQFMAQQIERSGNDADVDVFTDAAKIPRARSWDDVPTTALVPAFMLSELKVAFALGFKIFLPFLIIDLVVSTLLVSMGMMMLPPVMVSLPFKLLLFVLADGWRLITAGLIGSFVG